jgi:methionyl-tRNA formyltransferase
MKVIFFGTPQFAAQTLTYLLENDVQVVAVISKPDRSKGRSASLVATPVKEIALAHHLPLYQPELVSAPEFSQTLQSYEADLFVVVAYGEIIKQHLLDMPKLGCINLHASLLPAYRGAAPIQRSIMNGEAQSGITVMHMVKKMDAGNMIEAVTVDIGLNMTFGELEKALCEVGKKALLKVIKDFEKGRVEGTAQDHSQATFAPKIELEDCEVKWELPAQVLHNLVRGSNPHPGAWCYVLVRGEKKRLKIMQTKLHANQASHPGSILSDAKQNLIVGTPQGALELVQVQLEGKKAMQSAELIRGIPLQDLSFL